MQTLKRNLISIFKEPNRYDAIFIIYKYANAYNAEGNFGKKTKASIEFTEWQAEAESTLCSETLGSKNTWQQ